MFDIGEGRGTARTVVSIFPQCKRALQTHRVDPGDQEMVMAFLRDLSSCQTVLYQKDIAALSYLVAMVCGQRTDKEIKKAATTGLPWWTETRFS